MTWKEEIKKEGKIHLLLTTVAINEGINNPEAILRLANEGKEGRFKYTEEQVEQAIAAIKRKVGDYHDTKLIKLNR